MLFTEREITLFERFVEGAAVQNEISDEQMTEAWMITVVKMEYGSSGGDTCGVSSCDRLARFQSGICLGHENRLTYLNNLDAIREKNRGVNVVSTRATMAENGTLSYMAAHAYLKDSVGSARGLECVDCGESADEWSFAENSHCGNVVYAGVSKRDSVTPTRPYCPHGRSDCYEARCRGCHKVEMVASLAARREATQRELLDASGQLFLDSEDFEFLSDELIEELSDEMEMEALLEEYGLI